MKQTPKILPFKGLHYNTQKIADMSCVVTPPYDVISSDYQKELDARSPYNFVKIDFSLEEGEARYPASQKRFLEWVENNVLTSDAKPAYYFHHQTFKLPNGKTVTRKGFFGVRRVEDFSEGGIKPHEKTLDGPKADRLNLTRALNTNLSPIFSLYSDPKKEIDAVVEKFKKEKPLFDFVSKDGERHELWKVEDETVFQTVGSFFEARPLFIADGHHRYETSVNYRNECRKKSPPGDGLEAFNYVLMYFSNMNDDGLTILPIHRALHNLHGLTLDSLLKELQKFFEVKQISGSDSKVILNELEKLGADSHAYAMITKDPNQTYLISLKKSQWTNSEIAKKISPSLRNLDVTVLHRVIFEELLKITPEAQAGEKNIIYWKETQKAIDETRKGHCELTFLLNPTRIEQMEEVANAGEKMPQKSTFFYPKIVSGLVLHSLQGLEK